MDRILLDTDVFSMFFRHDTRRLMYREVIRQRVQCLSFASIAELRFGAIISGWGHRRISQLDDAIRQMVMLPADMAVVEHWAQIKAQRQQMGRPIASEDCWIAATALRHGVPLVTHNAADYARIAGLTVISYGG